jgi:putative ABC transporter-associated repeat protein
MTTERRRPRARRTSRPARAAAVATLALVLASAGAGAGAAAATADPLGDAGSPAATAAPGGWADLPLSGRTVLSVGHVDLLSTVSASALHLEVHDDSRSPAVPHEPDAATLFVAPSAHRTSPVLAEVFGPGVDQAWALPQAPDPTLLWPGWNVSPNGTEVTWTLDDVRGPGEAALFESGTFGDIRVLLSSGAAPRSMSYSGHAHAWWAFTHEGVYCLDSTFSAGSGAARRADDVTLLLAVGDVDPERVTSEMCGRTPEEIVAGDARPGTSPLPVAAGDLTDASRGGVRTGGAALTTAGGGVEVGTGEAHAGRWVSLWWYAGGTPTDLGWHRADSDGWARGAAVAATSLGTHRLAVLGRDGALVGWTPVVVTAPAPVPDDPTPPPAPQPLPPAAPGPGTPAAEVCTPTPVSRTIPAGDVAVAARGHFDYGSQLVDGRLVARVKDDAGTWRDPGALVLHVPDAGREQVPAGYGFLGTPGSTVWRIPESTTTAMPWLGWNTQHPSLVDGLSGPVTFTLAGVEGPGDVIVYMSGALGGAPHRVFDTVGGPRSIAVPLHTHQHANWVFTQPGAYHLTVTQSGTTAGGARVSASGTLHLFVGGGDPRAAAASTQVTEWVGRTPAGGECALSAEQLASSRTANARTAVEAAPVVRAAAQVAAPAAAAQAEPGEPSVRTRERAPEPTAAAPPDAADEAVPVAGTAVTGVLGALSLAGAAFTGRTWWRRTGGGIQA